MGNVRSTRGFGSRFPALGTLAQRALRPGDHLRCVLFHDIAPSPTAFTAGLDVTMAPDAFESRVRHLTRRYTPVTLDEALDGSRRTAPDAPPVLVTFDDAYSSVAHTAAPILRRFGIPAVLFANAAPVVEDHVLTDNLVAYALNTQGFGVLDAAARSIRSAGLRAGTSLGSVLSSFVARLGPDEVAAFRSALCERLGTDPHAEAKRQHLYLNAAEVRALPASGVAVASHTYSHVWARSLDETECAREIAANAGILSDLTGARVRGFSIPYGRSEDLTPVVRTAVRDAGHDGVFVVEARVNPRALDREHISRVSMREAGDVGCYLDIEVKPRLRKLKDRIERRSRVGRPPDRNSG